MQGFDRPAATSPFKHRGRHFDRELCIEQSVFQLCPSKHNLRPGNIITLELFQVRAGCQRLSGPKCSQDRVVAWAVLPMADSQLRGSYRIPVMRGEPDPRITLHSTLERMISEDLGIWLGNLYLEVRCLPREMYKVSLLADGGLHHKEHDIEFDHVNKLLNLGDLNRTNKDNVDPPHSRRECDTLPASTSPYIKGDTGTKDLVAQHEKDGKGDSRKDERDHTDHSWEGDLPSVVPEGSVGGKGGGIVTHNSEASVGVPIPNHGSRGRKFGREGKKNSDGVHPSSSSSGRTLFWEWMQTAVSLGKRSWLWGLLRSRTKVEVKVIPTEGSDGLGGSRVSADRTDPTHTRKRLGEKDGGGGGCKEPLDSSTYGECWSDDDIAQDPLYSFEPSGEAANTADAAAGLAHNCNGLSGRVRKRGEGARWDDMGLGLTSSLKETPGRGGNSSDQWTWSPLTNPEERKQFRFAVAPEPGGSVPGPDAVVRHKLRYLRHEVMPDLSPRNCKSLEYCLTLVLGASALWLRMYLHFLGQWALLRVCGVPVFGFSPGLYTFPVKYLRSSVGLHLEVGVVAWGPIFTSLCFALLAAWARFLFICGLPEAISQFTVAFGVATVFDPLLVLAVDLLAGNHGCSNRCIDYTSPLCRCHEGDAWKLYTWLEKEEAAGIAGALATFLIYFATVATATTFLFQYLIHIHMSGRILDVWRRLHAPDDAFFVPHDLEISLAELRHICALARKWRAPDGIHRVVVAQEHKMSKSALQGGIGTSRKGQTHKVEGDSEYITDQVMTHVAIYDVDRAGVQQRIHRYFLRTPEGIILELFKRKGLKQG
ncbi:unnamed protein product, partial [Choristocarpus tenellus]